MLPFAAKADEIPETFVVTFIAPPAWTIIEASSSIIGARLPLKFKTPPLSITN